MAELPHSATLEARRSQMFPALEAGEIEPGARGVGHVSRTPPAERDVPAHARLVEKHLANRRMAPALGQRAGQE